MSLAGKRAVITGASSGIGAATARALSELGAELVLGARRVDRLEALRRELRSAAIHALDVTDAGSSEAFARFALARPVDILVNNAGMARGLEPIAAGDEAGWKEMLDTNVLGLLRTTRLFLPAMLERREGHIVNVGSVAGMDPYAGGAVYCATKAAVSMISRTLRHELHGTGLRVSTIDPGLVSETEFSQVRFRGDAARAEKPYQDTEPLVARDVADCIAFVVTRPKRVNIEEVLVLATAQVGATKVHRTPR